jgi:hypothetical protein
MWFLKLIPFGEFLAKEAADWVRRRDTLKEVTLTAEVADIKARTEMAAYRVKADLEWDISWADQASKSWKDEFMLVLWAFPLIGLFIPGIRPFIMEGFDYLRLFHSEAPTWYMAGWAIIFAATFGFKQAAALMLPGKAASLAGILAGIPGDIPPGVADKAQSAVDKALNTVRAGLKS